MSQVKNFSFIRYFDILAPPYYQKINQDHYKKKTVLGGLLSLLIIVGSLSYFIYLMIQFQIGGISPKQSQFDEFKEEGVQYEFPSRSLSINIYQLQNSIGIIEQQTKIQFFDIVLVNSSNNDVINAIFTQNVFTFGFNKNYPTFRLERSTLPFQGNNIILIVQKCSGKFMRDESYRCATSAERDKLLMNYELYVDVILLEKSFSIKKGELLERFFSSQNFFSNTKKALSVLTPKRQDIEVQTGLFFQQKKSYQQIYELKQNNFYSQLYPSDQTYAEILITIDDMVRQTQIQYPQLPEVFAQVWGITSMLLLIRYVFQYIAQATLAQDFLGIQLKYYYKKTALRLFGQKENQTQKDENSSYFKQAETIIKKNEEIQQVISTFQAIKSNPILTNLSFIAILQNRISFFFIQNTTQFFIDKNYFFLTLNFIKQKRWKFFFFPKFCLKRKKQVTQNEQLLDQLIRQTSKDMSVFEMQKELIKLRTAIKLLLTPEQYSAIQMCGCDLVIDQQFNNNQPESNLNQVVFNSQDQSCNNNRESTSSISDIQIPISNYQINNSIIQQPQEKALNHLELMNQIDTNPNYRQICLEKFIDDDQQNCSQDQQLLNQRILNSMIGFQSDYNALKEIKQYNQLNIFNNISINK